MYERAVVLFSRIGLVVASVLLAAMVLVTVTDVFMRYVFSAPLASGAEITRILLTMTVFAGFILVSRDGSHIVVSIFEPVLTRVAPNLYRLLYAISNFLGSAFVLWVLVLTARDSWVFQETTEALDVPMIWILGVLVVLCALAVVTSTVVFRKGRIGQETGELEPR